MSRRWLVLLALGAGACSSNGNNPKPDIGQPGDANQVTSETGGGADRGKPVGPGQVGSACTADADCQSGMCFASKCAKACSQPSDCGAAEDCGSDDGQRLFCYARKYPANAVGASCAVTNTCPVANMWCVGPGAGGIENGEAYCTVDCTNDTDCPPAYTCSKRMGNAMCLRREFCERCSFDAQCRGGGKCVLQGKEKFCTLPCDHGSTECPRFAKCVDAGGGSFQCEHKAGTCVGDGSLCAPCMAGEDCAPGGVCLTFSTHETFCGSDCTTGGCPGGYTCQDIGSGKRQCAPAPAQDPSCVQLSPMMEVGDTMADLALVGYEDSNGNNSLEDEPLKVIRLSDYASKPAVKVILLSIGAGWCGPCQSETTLFAGLMTTYGSKGLMIVQTLFDTDVQQEPATVAFLNSWIKNLHPAGACTVDPAGNTLPYNTAGETPLNMILDAKTRKVLAKFYTASSLDAEIKKALGL